MNKREARRQALVMAAACLAHHRFQTDAYGERLTEGEDKDWVRINDARQQIAQRLATMAGEKSPGAWIEEDGQ